MSLLLGSRVLELSRNNPFNINIDDKYKILERLVIRNSTRIRNLTVRSVENLKEVDIHLLYRADNIRLEGLLSKLVSFILIGTFHNSYYNFSLESYNPLLQVLVLKNITIEYISFNNFPEIRDVTIENSYMKDPVISSNLSKLTNLTIKKSNIKHFSILGELNNLSYLNLSSNKLERFSINSKSTKNLEELYIENNYLNSFDLSGDFSDHEALYKLKILNVENNLIEHFFLYSPLRDIKNLYLSNNYIKFCDFSFSIDTKLNRVSLDNNTVYPRNLLDEIERSNNINLINYIRNHNIAFS